MELKPGQLCILLLLLCMAIPCLGAVCDDKTDSGAWLDCRIQARIAAKAANMAPGTNALNVSKQQEAPTVSPQSTSLVDQSSASDFFNLALNLAQASGGSGNSNNTNSISVTTSAYALYAAANYHDPLDPAFYARNRNWRRAYLTLGRDLPDSTSASSDPHLNQPGTIGGVKLLLYDKRDISDPSNQKLFEDAAKALAIAGGAHAKVMVALSTEIPGIAGRTSFKDLTDAQNKQIDDTIDQNIGPLAAVAPALQNVANQIRSQSQWSVSYQVDARNEMGYDEHKAETAFALGPEPHINFTVNGAYEMWNAKKFGRNRQGGNFAGEFDYRVTEDMSVAQPYILSLSAQGEWLTTQKPTYKAQLKLTIPLGQKTGVSIPASVTYASRTDLIQESRIEGRFGFTFDAAKVAAALSGHQ
jgi:hypothetical protein